MPITSLPLELQLDVFSHLDYISRLRMSSTNHHFRAVLAADTGCTLEALLRFELENRRFLEESNPVLLSCNICLKMLPEDAYYKAFSYVFFEFQ